MEPQKRTHLVNELIEEANLMQTVLEKAMEGEAQDESHPTLHGAHPHGMAGLQEEHKAWRRVYKSLADIQSDLARIEHAEKQRLTQE